MPPVSEKQRRAMFAAVSGKSTLGIPKKVAKEFVKADKGVQDMNIKPQTGRRNYAKGGMVMNAIAEEGGEELKHLREQLKGYPENLKAIEEDERMMSSLL